MVWVRDKVQVRVLVSTGLESASITLRDKKRKQHSSLQDHTVAAARWEMVTWH